MFALQGEVPMEGNRKPHVCRILIKVDNLSHHLYRFWGLFCGAFYPSVAFLYVGLGAARSPRHRIWGIHSCTQKIVTILVKVIEVLKHQLMLGYLGYNGVSHRKR